VSGWFHTALSAADLLGLFGHFLVLSLFAVGGAITTAPDMHRYVVAEHHWISDAQFTSSIAIAQAAPGPNVLFVATLGWSVAGPLGAIATMFGTLIPSTLLTLAVTRWGAKRKELRAMPGLSVAEKVEAQRGIKKLEGQRDELMLSKFQRKKDVRHEVEDLLDSIQASLKLTPEQTPLFTIRWEIRA